MAGLGLGDHPGSCEVPVDRMAAVQGNPFQIANARKSGIVQEGDLSHDKLSKLRLMCLVSVGKMCHLPALDVLF